MTGPRGPAPTPTPILKMRGSRLAKGREKQGEPSPERGRPERPSNIVSESRKLWTKLTGLLDDMGVLTKIDGGQLERYCLMFVQWRQLQRVIERMSGTDDALILSLKRDDARPILRNAWAEAHRLDAALKQIEMQFGLTPASRARLSCLVNGNSDGVNKDDRETFFFSGAG